MVPLNGRFWGQKRWILKQCSGNKKGETTSIEGNKSILKKKFG
jgi:hypothetical protein